MVLLGATGFTGALVAERLAACTEPVRWAIAGRDRARLAALAQRLRALGGAGEVPVLAADVADQRSLERLASSTRVLATTVGPYLLFGEPVVAACAAAGTDYVDITGEPEFVDRMWLRHHEQARRTGARLVHSCGFDSIPSDLGALHAVGQLPEGVPISLEARVRGRLAISGGTLRSALEAVGRPLSARRAARLRRSLEGSPAGRTVRGVRLRPRPDPEGGGWLVPMPTIDPVTVLRSARALDRYGPHFSYSHDLVVASLPGVVALGAAAGALAIASALPPARAALERRRPPGEGPDESRRAQGWFSIRFCGRADGACVRTEVAGGDPGYGETSKMLAQAALCLALDELPETSGQVTPAVAMGHALIERLRRVGIEFRTLA
ncbi:MAG TPA: saccharopine dehydrogenase NADP-binding domain-containing protein [Solirubrobacteraceae bacterium]|nr:saccharopine dehydrogenase NADP-binding domain-containing protein [Solirubrobacteraceae bacterium]